MNLKLLTSALGVVALSALLSAPVNAAIIFADNFNTPAFPVGTTIVTYGTGSSFLTTPSTVAGTTGWFVNGAGIDHQAPFANAVGSDGDAWVDLNSTDAGSMEILLSGLVTPGSNYTLSFNMNSVFGSGIHVEIWDGYATTTFQPSWVSYSFATAPATGDPITQGSWVNYAVNFTAPTTGDIIVKLGSASGGITGPLIDELEIRDAAVVPEPSTLILCGLGLVGFAMYRRRS